MFSTLRRHWPEYLIEAWALGTFMLSAAVFTTLIDRPGTLVHRLLGDADLRRMLIGIAMGLTAIGLIYSPWGQRSGAHMNPAVTLTFLRLGRIRGPDAIGYIAAQLAGGVLGVLSAAALLGAAFTEPPVNHVVTVPGPRGAGVAFAAELAISAAMMLMILASSASPHLAKYTGVFAGVLVATWITVEGPLSGMSMNPARTVASAVPARLWDSLWIYLTAPVIGMQLGALAHRLMLPRQPAGCAKLQHGTRQRCIHCGYEPARGTAPAQAGDPHSSKV
jgi:aquaporin Z